MLKISNHVFLLTVTLAVALSSCAHTKLVSTWKDPEYKGPPKKILVHIMARNPDVKAIVENQLVEKFEEHGMAALASHRFLADELVIDKAAMKKLVVEKGIDTIFIAGPKNRQDLQTLRPGQMTYESAVYADPDDGFYAAVSAYGYKPGTYAEEEDTAEMVIYDVTTRKRVWSAVSKTYVWNTRVEEIEPAVDRVVKALVADKIIP